MRVSRNFSAWRPLGEFLDAEDCFGEQFRNRGNIVGEDLDGLRRNPRVEGLKRLVLHHGMTVGRTKEPLSHCLSQAATLCLRCFGVSGWDSEISVRQPLLRADYTEHVQNTDLSDDADYVALVRVPKSCVKC